MVLQQLEIGILGHDALRLPRLDQKLPDKQTIDSAATRTNAALDSSRYDVSETSSLANVCHIKWRPGLTDNFNDLDLRAPKS